MIDVGTGNVGSVVVIPARRGIVVRVRLAGREPDGLIRVGVVLEPARTDEEILEGESVGLARVVPAVQMDGSLDVEIVDLANDVGRAEGAMEGRTGILAVVSPDLGLHAGNDF